MLKDATFKEKCLLLKDWMPQILDMIKKDLKNDHLKKDFKFVKKYFVGKNINKLTLNDFAEAYLLALENEENAEEIAEFLTNRWLLKNTEVYECFERHLSRISPDFTQLTVIEENQADEMIQESISKFGAPCTYLFAVLNSVVFSPEVYKKLEKQAQEARKSEKVVADAAQKVIAYEALKEHYELQLNRLTDKYEKKISGMERKYCQDTEALKKQLIVLQKKLTVEKGT